MTTKEAILNQQEINRNLKSKEFKQNNMIKRIDNIKTLSTLVNNETHVDVTDENGEDFTIVLNTISLLEWLNKDTIKYMKEQTKKYITNL